MCSGKVNGVVLLISLNIAGPANAQSMLGKQIISIYADLNEMCRGWAGDDPHTDEACGVRLKVSNLLTSMGYCFGKKDEFVSEMVWHKCAANSNR
jgi:hypothetical protein